MPNPASNPPSDDRLDDLVVQALAAKPLAFDRALLTVHARLRARIQRRLPADIQAVVGPDDILQDAFTEAFRAFPSFSVPPTLAPGTAFFKWLCTIAERRIIDSVRALRAAKRGGGPAARHAADAARPDLTTLAPLIDILAIHQHTPSRSAAGHEVEAALRAALDSLYPAYRQALELRYLQGLSPPEVARRLDRTEEAVHKLCSRALGALREAMGDPGRFLTRSD